MDIEDIILNKVNWWDVFFENIDLLNNVDFIKKYKNYIDWESILWDLKLERMRLGISLNHADGSESEKLKEKLALLNLSEITMEQFGDDIGWQNCLSKMKPPSARILLIEVPLFV